MDFFAAVPEEACADAHGKLGAGFVAGLALAKAGKKASAASVAPRRGLLARPVQPYVFSNSELEVET